jgi:heme iron utilization protein
MTNIDYDKTVEAKNILQNANYGVLSTHSLDLTGYPYGSVVTYSLDELNRPNFLISSMAEHTKNILANPKASLIVVPANSQATNILSEGRFTYIGDIEKVPESEIDSISKKHLEIFPNAKRYLELSDFSFYRINLVKGRFIGGFGKIFWIEPFEFDNF